MENKILKLIEDLEKQSSEINFSFLSDEDYASQCSKKTTLEDVISELKKIINN